MNNAPFEVIHVSKDELHNIYGTPVEFTAQFTEEVFDRQWEHVRDAIRKALSLRWSEGWEPGDDFLVSDDRTNTWAQCGGIYTPRICCHDYVATILHTLADIADSDKWAYHTAVEVVWRPEDAHPVTPPYASGGFVIRSGRVFIPKDGHDYSRFYKLNQKT